MDDFLEAWGDASPALQKIARWTAPRRLQNLPKELHPEVFAPAYRLVKIRLMWLLSVATFSAAPIAAFQFFAAFGGSLSALAIPLATSVSLDLAGQFLRIRMTREWTKVGERSALDIANKVADHAKRAEADAIRELGIENVNAFLGRGASALSGLYMINSIRLERSAASICGLFISAPLILGPLGLVVAGALLPVSFAGYRKSMRLKRENAERQSEADLGVSSALERRARLESLLTLRRVGPAVVTTSALSNALEQRIRAEADEQRNFASTLRRESWKSLVVTYLPMIVAAYVGSWESVASLMRPMTQTYIEMSNLRSEGGAVMLAQVRAKIAAAILALPSEDGGRSADLLSLHLESCDAIEFHDVQLWHKGAKSDPATFSIPLGHRTDIFAGAQRKQGSITAVIGRTGSGKTSAFEALIGLRLLVGGRITIAGRSRSEYSTSSTREQIVCAGSSNVPLIEDLREMPGVDRFVVEKACRLTACDDELAEKILDSWDTGNTNWTNHLSSGQHIRVVLVPLLARVLARDSQVKLVVLDEPTTALDPEVGEALIRTLLVLKDLGLTVVVPTHEPRVAKIADWMVMMTDEGGVTPDREGLPCDLLAPGGVAHSWLKAAGFSHSALFPPPVSLTRQPTTFTSSRTSIADLLLG